MFQKLISLVGLCLLTVSHLQAQLAERAFSAGFSTETQWLSPYGNDGWLLAGRGWPEPGAYFQDTLFVAIVDFDGQVLLRKNLSMPSEEVHFFHDLLALPDGGILLSFESTLCDVSGYLLSVQRLDSQGVLLWEKTAPFAFGQPRPPEKWFVAPDGNLLGAGYDQIWKVNALTGDVIWKAPLDGVSSGNIGVFEMKLVPGTEDFYALGNPSFQYWQSTGNPNSPEYVLQKSAELPGYRRLLTLSPAGGFYCMQYFPDGQIEYIDANLAAQALPMSIEAAHVAGIAMSDHHLWLSESNLGVNNRLRKFDFQGLNPVELQAPSQWFFPVNIAAHHQQIALFGANISGSDPTIAMRPYGSAAWIRSFPENSGSPLAQNPNAAVVDLEQLSPLDTSQSPGFPPFAFLYNLSGGDFRVKVANTGDTTLQSVGINVVFDANLFYFCPNVPAKQKIFDHLNLAPGESIWLDFGDVEAFGQAQAPTEICFWTSVPNEQPDAEPLDDRFCSAVSYTVGLNDPDPLSISVFPNPCDAMLTITSPAGSWQLFDARGRMVSEGKIEGQQSALQLDTSTLPNGLYLLQMQHQVAKFVVLHP